MDHLRDFVDDNVGLSYSSCPWLRTHISVSTAHLVLEMISAFLGQRVKRSRRPRIGLQLTVRVLAISRVVKLQTSANPHQRLAHITNFCYSRSWCTHKLVANNSDPEQLEYNVHRRIRKLVSTTYVLSFNPSRTSLDLTIEYSTRLQVDVTTNWEGFRSLRLPRRR